MRAFWINAPVAIVLAMAAAGYAGDSGVQLQISQGSIHVGLHEPVIANITLYNASDAPSHVDLGLDFKAEYRLAVTHPDGHHTEIPPRAIEGGVIGEVIIGAGKSYTRPFLLTEWIPFETIGTYVVDVRLEGARNKLTLEVIVGPRDAGRLNQVCDAFAKQLDSKLGDPFWSARVLSLIPDPVAIPFLAKVGDVGLEPFAIKGLARIGDRDAALAIRSIMDKSPEEIVIVLARNALKAIRRTTTDEALKGEINLFLVWRLDLDKKYDMPQ